MLWQATFAWGKLEKALVVFNTVELTTLGKRNESEERNNVAHKETDAIYFIVMSKTKYIKMKKTSVFRVAKNAALLGLSMLSGCALFPVDPSPPAAVFEAWKKPSTPADRVLADMRSCGYRNVATANDLSATEAATAEACMKGLGYKLDLSSYKPNNCYGQNSPYFCNRYWGGGKPAMVPVNAGGAQ